MISMRKTIAGGISARALLAAALAAGLWLAPAFLPNLAPRLADSAHAGGSNTGFDGYMKQPRAKSASRKTATAKKSDVQVAGGAGIDGFTRRRWVAGGSTDWTWWTDDKLADGGNGGGYEGYTRRKPLRKQNAVQYAGGAGVDGYVRTPKKKPAGQ
jgi:hypothetical protein